MLKLYIYIEHSFEYTFEIVVVVVVGGVDSFDFDPNHANVIIYLSHNDPGRKSELNFIQSTDLVQNSSDFISGIFNVFIHVIIYILILIPFSCVSFGLGKDNSSLIQVMVWCQVDCMTSNRIFRA